MEWANTPESNRLANGRCRNPNDPTTTIECQQQTPLAARPPEAPRVTTTRGDTHDLEAGRQEVLAKARTGSEEEAARLFWDLPMEARTTAFATALSKVRTERINSLESKPHEVAEAVTSLKLDKLPGDEEVLRALAGRVSKALSNLARPDGADENAFRLGASLVQLVRRHPSEMAEGAVDGVGTFEEKYGPALAAAELKDEGDWRTFIALYPESKYSRLLEENIAQLDRLAAISAATKRREQEADELWANVRAKGDALAELSFKIAFAQKHFSSSKPGRRGIQNMRAHYPMLVADEYCPARKEFVDALGPAEFATRAAQHCKETPPTSSGVQGAEVVLAKECRVAFATACSP